MRSWGRIEGVVGAILLGGVMASVLRWIPLQFCFKRSHDRTWCHDQATIGPRSWNFLLPHSVGIMRRVSWHWFHDERATIAARLRRNHGSIGPRSWSSSTNLPRRSMELQVSGRSRFTQSSMPRSWGGSTASRLIGEDRGEDCDCPMNPRPMKPWSNRDDDPTFLAPPRVGICIVDHYHLTRNLHTCFD